MRLSSFRSCSEERKAFTFSETVLSMPPITRRDCLVRRKQRIPGADESTRETVSQNSTRTSQPSFNRTNELEEAGRKLARSLLFPRSSIKLFNPFLRKKNSRASTERRLIKANARGVYTAAGAPLARERVNLLLCVAPG